jgi:hypothetical protein
VQETRRLRSFAQFSPQPGQVHIDGLVSAAIRCLPHLCGELTLADHLAGAGRKVVEQVELPRCQLELRPVQRRFPRPRVDPQAADDHRLVPVLTGAGSAQDGSDPRVQLRATERLDQVVIGAGLENGDDLRIAVAGGGDDDGDVVDRPQHDLAARGDVEVRFEGEDTDFKVKIRCADGRPVAKIDKDG